MILTDNLIFLKKTFPHILEMAKKYEETRITNWELESAKNGVPTLKYVTNNSSVYIHSKYDPLKEAASFIDKFPTVSNYKHIFFYGLGLGYYIEAFFQKHPHIPFTIYEPNPEVLHQYLSTRSLNQLPVSYLKNFHVETGELDKAGFLDRFVDSMKDEVLFVPLPSYERIFHDRFVGFSEQFKNKINDRKNGLLTNISYEKRWIFNSLWNLPETINTPNILHEEHQSFKNKPVLLVSAGPSLSEEIENIRYIKEHNLAYIFSVGSAINALIEHDIYPDAACTYDPTVLNQKVFEKVVQRNIKTIPLIYGSSVGFETLQQYPGPKMHMITSQDTVAPFYLKYPDNHQLRHVQDAPSIAVVALELFNKLEFNPVILVGQNLAYRNNQVYSKGINYAHRSNEITEIEKANGFITKDVYGNDVLTTSSFNRMRNQMEFYIQTFLSQEFINTTQGGAHIQGTSFIPLDELIQTRLTRPIEKYDWNHQHYSKHYDTGYLIEKCNQMEEDLQGINQLVQKIISILSDIHDFTQNNHVHELQKAFPKLDKVFKKILKNKVFEVFIGPMNRVGLELLSKNTSEFRFEKDLVVKGEKVVQEFGKVITQCKRDIQGLSPILFDIHQKIKNQLSQHENSAS